MFIRVVILFVALAGRVVVHMLGWLPGLTPCSSKKGYYP